MVSMKWLLGVLVTIIVALAGGLWSTVSDNHRAAQERLSRLEAEQHAFSKAAVLLQADLGYVVKALEDLRMTTDEQRRILTRAFGEPTQAQRRAVPGFGR